MMALALFSLQFVCLWPSWYWFAHRTYAGSDEPLAALALLTAICFCWFSRNNETVAISARNLLWPVAALFAYLFAMLFLPQSVQFFFAVVAQVMLTQALFYARKLPASIWGLILLTVPSVATLNFYIGFPLRGLLAQASAVLLSISGFASTAQGVQLFVRGHEVVIDSACSGIHMLWISVYLACVLSYFARMNFRSTCWLLASAGVLALLGNVQRAVSICVYEASPLAILQFTDFAHQASGASSFVLVAVALWFISTRIPSTGIKEATNLHLELPPDSRISSARHRPALLAFFAVCIMLGILPLNLFRLPRAAASTISGVTARTRDSVCLEETRLYLRSRFGWNNLKSHGLTGDEQSFSKRFPGYICKFSDDNRSYLVRHISSESRQVHSVADCYSGSGYKIKWLPIAVRAGTRWGRFEASKAGSKLLVSETILDESGAVWTDPSSWYWATLLGRTSGPWWFISVVEH